jgi:hypothetical protein
MVSQDSRYRPESQDLRRKQREQTDKDVFKSLYRRLVSVKLSEKSDAYPSDLRNQGCTHVRKGILGTGFCTL